MSKTLRVNERIRSREVRVIDENGAQLGIMFTRDALNMARTRDYDLVEVAPNAVPPVCRMLDYGKFRYEQSKKERDARKSQHNVVIKEVRLTPTTGDHDVDFKVKQARSFLEDGHKVKMTVQFKGRELTHTEIGRQLLDQILEIIQNEVIIELPPKMEGKNMTMILAPKPIVKPQAPRPPRAQPAADGAPQPAPTNGAAPVAPSSNGAPAAPAVAPAPAASAATERVS